MEDYLRNVIIKKDENAPKLNSATAKCFPTS